MAGQPHGEGDEGFDPHSQALPADLVLDEEIVYRLPHCGLRRRLISLRRRPS